MLTKTSGGVARGPRLNKALAGMIGSSIDRRAFLKRSGLAAGGIAVASTMNFAMVKKAAAAVHTTGLKKVKSVCTHCAVGCTVITEVKSGIWIGQEPGFDSPLNNGTHCAREPRSATTPMAPGG